MNKNKLDLTLKILKYMVLTIGAVFMLLPFIWMLSTSLKQPAEVFAYPIKWIPEQINVKSYWTAFFAFPFPRFFLNSLIVTLGITFGQLITSVLAAYAFARMKFKGSEFIFTLLLTGLMIPEQTTMIPVTMLLSKLGWINSYQGLIIPFAWSSLNVFLFRQYFTQIPKEIDESAYMDGCSDIRIIWSIILPIAKPIISTVFVLTFIYGWNQYFWPLILTNKEEYYTLQLGLSYFRDYNSIDINWPALMAGSTIVISPVIIVYVFFQKYIIDSIAFTGSKN